MAKEIPLTVRIDQDTSDKLDVLTTETVRNKSDMVRYLIHKEYAQHHTQYPEGQYSKEKINE